MDREQEFQCIYSVEEIFENGYIEIYTVDDIVTWEELDESGVFGNPDTNIHYGNWLEYFRPITIAEEIAETFTNLPFSDFQKKHLRATELDKQMDNKLSNEAKLYLIELKRKGEK